MTTEPEPSKQKGLEATRLLIRVLSAIVPRHRREEWREEWEAELINRSLETSARAQRQRVTSLRRHSLRSRMPFI